jgi:hypothetical protein
MAKKTTTSARNRRTAKYFELHESNSRGLEVVWRVYKKKRGFYLWASEEGELGGPGKTISEALSWEANQYGGEYAEIETNIQLEELFEIMNTISFEPFLHNLSRLTLNGAEIDVHAFKNFVIWYANSRAASATKK